MAFVDRETDGGLVYGILDPLLSVASTTRDKVPKSGQNGDIQQ